MGSNPSKSQQLQTTFPQCQICPDLTLSSQNPYDFIFVNKINTTTLRKQIFVIKQSLKQPLAINCTVKGNKNDVQRCANIVKIQECRKIDDLYYTMYEWLNTSLGKYLSNDPNFLNRGQAVFILQTLLKVYALLWRNCQGNGLDIVPQNIRIGSSSPSSIFIKVFPPSMTTHLTSSQAHQKYRNKVSDLGQIIYKFFKPKHQQIGNDVMQFISNRMGVNVNTNVAVWDALERDSKLINPAFGPFFDKGAQGSQEWKYGAMTTPNKWKQNPQRSRSASPISERPERVTISPFKFQQSQVSQMSQVSQGYRPVSPISVQHRNDASPNISRISIYEQNKKQVQSARLHSPYSQKTNAHLNQNQNINQNINQNQNRNISPVKFTTNPVSYNNKTMFNPLHSNNKPNIIFNQSNNNFTKNKEKATVLQKNIHQKPQTYTYHQNSTTPTNQNISSPSYTYSTTNAKNTPVSDPFKTISPLTFNKDEVYQTIVLENGEQSLYKDKNINKQINNVSNFNILPNDSVKRSSIIKQKFNLERVYESQKKLTLPSLLNNLNIAQSESKIVNRQEHPLKLQSPLIINQKQPERKQQPFLKIQKSLPIFALFQPSIPDPLQIRPKLGVPNSEFVLKTKIDKCEQQQNGNIDTCRSSLNLLPQSNRQNNQINQLNLNQKSKQSHLNVKTSTNPNRQLFGSSIPFATQVQNSSSFGLNISQDSQAGNYQGIYQGSYHPSFPTTKHGVGKMLFPSGGSYQGHFSWNKMDGWGKLFYPSGRLAYEGYWKNSKFEGYGKLFNENATHIENFDYMDFRKAQETEDGYWKYYQGNMKNDMKEGHGIWVMENGEKYDGEFQKDMVHGHGVFYGKKKNIQGVWQNNVLVRVVKQL